MDFMGRLTFKTQFFSNKVPKKIEQCLFKNITNFYFYFFSWEKGGTASGGGGGT